jgi:hypothetical protein
MKGSCFCGAVHYEISPPFKIFQYCHCSRCRKYTGSAFSPNLFVPPDQFQWLQGESLIGSYEPPETKYFATCFCKQCGSTLPWTVKGGMNVVVPTGTLDEDPGIKPQRSVFWESRATWLTSDCELEKFEKLPPRK